MCHLNPHDQEYIAQALTVITDLSAQVGVDASAIAATAYMDHEHLAELLTLLSDRAAEVSAWVAAKPHEHAH